MKTKKFNVTKYFLDVIEESEKQMHCYMDKLENVGKKEEMDNCVNCGEKTNYPKNMNIDYRNYYIEGAGQLCKNCYDKIYS
jgi:recombinational DNA repair protein (RecF pathway)